MVDRENLTDFFNKVLDGTGYGKLSKTNRAYSWIKNNNALQGPCLNFLKDNITEQNLVTVKELNLFVELQKQGDVPSEAEIDGALTEYLGDTEIYFQNISLPTLHREVSQALKYYEALELEEKVLKRQCNKLQQEVNALKFQNELILKKKEAVLSSAIRTNTAYNNLSKGIQCELSKILQAFSAVLHDNIAAKEQNLFSMNFDTFRKINNTFRESVDVAIERQFNKTRKYDAECFTSTKKNDIDQSEALMSVAQSLGQYNYQSLKWQCEETELEELNDYIENVLKNFDFRNIDTTRLKTQMDADIESTYQVQKKIIHLSEVLEKFHSDYVIKKMLVAYRRQQEHNMKSDYKFLKKITDICTNFVDLMTLQACLSQKEKENVDWVIAGCDLGRQKLDEHTRKHSIAVMNLKKLTLNQKSHGTHNRSSNFSADSRINQSTLITSDNDDPVNVLQNRILSFIGDRLNEYFAAREQLNQLDSIMFSGPVRQIFFCSNLRNDELLIKQQYDHFNNQYKLWKAQYSKILEKTKVTELDQLQRSLGLVFLTDPCALRNNFEQLKNAVLQNKSKYSKTLTMPSVDSSNFSKLDLKKGHLSSAI